MKYLVLLLLIVTQSACAAPQEIDDHHWVGVERIVAIGDIHGDFENYMTILKSAELVNKKGKWAGGKTHLVQTGDVPDRGPDTLKIIEHLRKLTKEAKKKGGRVHTLIGNHESMNVHGDLRYVTTGEYAEFVDKNSEKLRERYFEIVMETMLKNDPDAFNALPQNMREEWEKDHPLGWLEHRQAWNPAWNPKADLGAWIFEQKVAIQVNDLIFLHGGISGFYCQNTLQSLTDKVVTQLKVNDPANPGILYDDFGPLWYRGLSGTKPEADPATVGAILDNHSAKHIVVGHTVTGGVIWPRYDGRVVQIDTGISAAYGGNMGYLEITAEGLFGGYPEGKVKLPEDDEGRVAYLEQVIELYPNNASLKKLLESLTVVAVATAAADSADQENQLPGSDEGIAQGSEAAVETVVEIPICGISP